MRTEFAGPSCVPPQIGGDCGGAAPARILGALRGKCGALGRIRTPDPQIRSLVLYPAELRARKGAAPGAGHAADPIQIVPRSQACRTGSREGDQLRSSFAKSSQKKAPRIGRVTARMIVDSEKMIGTCDWCEAVMVQL